MLRESGRAEEGLAAYEAALVTDPKRLRSFYGAGQAAAASNADKARYYFGRLVDRPTPTARVPKSAKQAPDTSPT